MILALDPARLCGFAHSCGVSGTLELCDAKERDSRVRVRKLRDRLTEIHSLHPFNVIAHEDASFGSPSPSVQAQHNELAGVIKLVAADLGCEVRTVFPTSLKKFATGSGLAKKPQMIAAYALHYKYTPRDDNEADALWVLRYIEHQLRNPLAQSAEKPKKRPRSTKPKSLF